MNQSALEARVYDSIESLANLHPVWEELLAAFPVATTFSTLDWLVPWWRAFSDGQQLRVVAFFDGTGHLVAVAPLSLTTRHLAAGIKLKLLRLMGDGSGDSDNLDLPVRPGYEAAFSDALLNFLAKNSDWDYCELNTLPSDSPAAAEILLRLQERQYCCFTSTRPQLVIDFPPDWQTYLGHLSSENRNNLERYTRRLSRRYQVQFHKCADESELEVCLDDLFRLHQKRWELRGEPGTFASAERRTFYKELSRALLAHHNLEFWILRLDDKTAAAQFCFRHKERVFLLQEGFDPKHAADRVGFILRGHVLKQLMAEGVRRYDFLFGESAGKYRWAPHSQHYQDIHFAPRFSRGCLYLKAINGARDGKNWLRAHLPKGAWATLHSLNSRLNGRSVEKASKLGNVE